MWGRITCGRDYLNATSYIRLPERLRPIGPRPKDARRSELALALALIVGFPTCRT